VLIRLRQTAAAPSGGRRDVENRNLETDEELIGIVSQDHTYSIGDDALDHEQLSAVERISSITRFASIQGSQLRSLSTPELTWLSERLPDRYNYSRKPGVDFDRANRIRFLLQVKSWLVANPERRVTFGALPEARPLREDNPPRNPQSGRRNREGDVNPRPQNRHRANNNRRIYYPSPDPAQEILSLTTHEIRRLSRNDIQWLGGLCQAIIAKYPNLRVEFNNRDSMSVLAAASTLQGKLDHLRAPIQPTRPQGSSSGAPLRFNIPNVSPSG